MARLASPRLLTAALMSATCLTQAVAADTIRTYSGTQLVNNNMGLSLDMSSSSRSKSKGQTFLIGVGISADFADGAVGELTPYSSRNRTLVINSVFLPLSSVTIDQSNGQILEEKFTGTITLKAVEDHLTTTGGTLSISNLTLDFNTQQIHADLSSSNPIDIGAGYVSGGPVHVQLMNTSSLTGTTNVQSLLGDSLALCLPGELCLPPYTYATGNTFFPGDATQLDASGLSLSLGTLSVSFEGQSAMSSGLGLFGAGISLLEGASPSFALGAVRALPEPSSLALMGLGLAGLMAARRNMRA